MRRFVPFGEYRCLSVFSFTCDPIGEKKKNLALFSCTHIHAWADTCHIANLALQMRKRHIKEPFSSILHLLAAAAVHELAGKQKSLARLGPKLPPTVSIQHQIHLAVKYLASSERKTIYYCFSRFCFFFPPLLSSYDSSQPYNRNAPLKMFHQLPKENVQHCFSQN